MTSALSDEEKALASTRLAAGRVLATESHPYLSRSLFAMVPVPREGLGTFAVDKRWRMYYDPKLCLEWSTKEIAAVWLHEAGHLIRDHSRRFEQYSEPQHAVEWNKAGDAAINSDLRTERISLPMADRRFYAEANAEYPQWRPGMTTEEMYEIAKGGSQRPSEPQPGGNSDDSEGDSSEESQEQENKDSQTQSGEVEEGKESEDTDSSADPSSSSGDSDSEESDTEGSSNGDASTEGSSKDSGDSTGKPDPSSNSSSDYDCGSGASGGKRDYEEPSDADDGSLDPDEAELVRQETAKEILDASQRGTVPAGMVREAEEIIDPQVDWRTELMSVVRRTCATVIGKRDYSYQRPSRRSAMTAFYLPSMRSPRPPEVAIVLDTSGSMTASDLAVALSEIQGIVERSSSSRRTLRVVNCDAAAAEVAVVESVENLQIIGGGGTDMRVGIKAASELFPRPDAVITITDGGTPWPTEPDDRNIVYINVIVKSNSRHSSIVTPPEWMHTIYVDRRPRRMKL